MCNSSIDILIFLLYIIIYSNKKEVFHDLEL